MDIDNKPFSCYGTGTGIEFWRNNVTSYGIDEAVVICSNHINENLKRELSEDERRFCREMFKAMYEATANKIVPSKLVYPYNFKTANERVETSYFDKSRSMNQTCARLIDEAIRASNYKPDYYNLEFAAMSVINECGFERVNAVLAFHIQNHEHDGRYSQANRKWAQNFTLPDKADTFLNSHAILIDGFAEYTRIPYADLGADRFALPGREEDGESEPNCGYEIIRSIMVDENQGYVIGRNPNNISPYVCWQFYIRDGKRSYNWGIYGEETDAIKGYNARVFVAFN